MARRVKMNQRLSGFQNTKQVGSVTSNLHFINESPHDKTNKMTYAPNEDSDQPGHPPSMIRVFVLRSSDSQGPKTSSC